MIVLKAAQAAVLGALQSVAGIVERRHTLPILANVLMRKEGDSIEFTTSDLEIQVRTRAELGGDSGSFSTTVGARKLIDILRALPSDQVITLTSAQNKLTLQGGKSRFTLQTLPSDDFPLVNESVNFGPTFSVPQKTLRDLLNQVHFAMAVSSSLSRRCNSSTVLRGKMTSCLLGTSASSVLCAMARRWPSVATRVSIFPSAMNRMPLR